jgi:hypothetical protein
MAQNYKVRLDDGSVITIENAATVEKDGAGLRFRDPEGVAIASFDDGQAKAHWPAGATVVEPAAVTDPPATE